MKRASRARRVDIGSSSQKSQPPVESVTAAWSRPRQRAQMRWRSLSLSGEWHEPHVVRGICNNASALLDSAAEAKHTHKELAMKGYRRIAELARQAEGGEDSTGFLRLS